MSRTIAEEILDLEEDGATGCEIAAIMGAEGLDPDNQVQCVRLMTGLCLTEEQTHIEGRIDPDELDHSVVTREATLRLWQPLWQPSEAA